MNILKVILFIAGGNTLLFGAGSITNADIVEMSRAGLPTGAIMKAIEQSEAKFETSPASLIELKKNGVEDVVIEAMLNSGQRKPAAPAGDLPAEDYLGEGRILMRDGDKVIDLVIMAQHGRPTGAAFFGLSQGFLLGFPPAKSETRIQNTRPVFENSWQPNVSGTNTVFLLRLVEKERQREFTMAGVGTFPKKSVVPMEAVQFQDPRRTPPGRKLWRYTPKVELAPGEYAIWIENKFYGFGVDGPEAAISKAP